jgi:ATP-dependent RNA helicase HelY
VDTTSDREEANVVASPAAGMLVDFADRYPFGLDAFQTQACEALAAGEGVLVAAPTGAGKTVVGEFAAHLALARGRRCFYTTPIKALSNQKYADFVARHGADAVGLLTGDTSRNGDAPIVVMTTEVLRNMLYAEPGDGVGGRLAGLDFVVMDEVHYLADRQRGAVWEEVIIHLPERVQLVSLSATVSNAEEFADWLVTVRGHTRVIVTEHRPVPLSQHVLAERTLYDLFADDGDAGGAGGVGVGGGGGAGGGGGGGLRPARPPATAGDAPGGRVVNPELMRLARQAGRQFGRPHRGVWAPGRPDVVAALDREGLLPAIVFVFSRVGCDAAVAACVRAGLRLITPEQAELVRACVRARTADIGDADLRILGYWEWLEGLVRGVAAHHAGMLPTFKETVEELFARGLVRAVFATETLALGINMPARTVVLERLTKFDGQRRAEITPGEYTQLTGRAGRRGIDVEGHAVVLWQPGVDPLALAGLASTRTYPLRSSFRPSYNMAVNLVGRLGREPARAVLESSFAQFQADRAVVGLARQVRRNLDLLARAEAESACEHGSVHDYDEIRRAIREREAALSREGSARRRAEAAASLTRLRTGDVVRVPAGRRSGLAVVLDADAATRGSPDGPRPVVLTADRQVKRLSLVDFPVAVEPLGRVRVPRGFNPRSPQSRRDLASSLRNVDLPATEGRRARARSAAARTPEGSLRDASGPPDAELDRLRRALRAHPVHGCAHRDEHLRLAERTDRLRRETAGLQRRVEQRTNTVAKTFDRVRAVLVELGYLDGDRLTEMGRMLGRIYTEQDLLVAECLRAGVWDGLTPAELAAAVSTLVYEPRGGAVAVAVPGVPGRPALRAAVTAAGEAYARLAEAESAHHLSFLRPPELGFAAAAFAWASGRSLERVLTEAGAELTAGDFVRWMRQLIDLLDQIAQLTPAATAADAGTGGDIGSTAPRAARAAVDAVRRGVVAYTAP